MKHDPITNAARLLREAAAEYAEGVSINGAPDWANEPDTHAAYLEHIAAAEALETMPGQCLHQIAEPPHPMACSKDEVQAFEAAAAPAAVAAPDEREAFEKAAGMHLLRTAEGYQLEKLSQIEASSTAAPAAPAVVLPEPVSPAHIQALHLARRRLFAIAKTYDDCELRTRATETDEEISRMLAGVSAPAIPADAAGHADFEAAQAAAQGGA